MGNNDIIGLVVVLAFFAVAMTVYVGLIVLGVNLAKRKNRSPHWMWFAIHPMGLLITLIIMACLSPLKRCPRCQQTSPQHARLCAFCGYELNLAAGFMPQPVSAYRPPPGY